MTSRSPVAISMFVPSAEREAEVSLWQIRLDRAASARQGFRGSRFATLTSDAQNWAAGITFDTETNLRDWLSSGERKTLCDEAQTAGIIAGPLEDVVLIPGERPPEETVVVFLSVLDGAEDSFLQAQEQLHASAATMQGFSAAALFSPGVVPGQWIAIMRFDSQENMDEWLTSPQRAAAIDAARPSLTHDVNAFTATTPFGSLVRIDGGAPAVTPRWKSAMTLLLVLFPTVMLLARFFSPRLDEIGMQPWLAVFVSNLVTIAALTWILMPLASRALRWWLDPIDGRPATITAVGFLVVCLGYLLALVVFALVPALELPH